MDYGFPIPERKMRERNNKNILINMGPQHPGVQGVLRLELDTDGEVVQNVIPHIGYLHRCFEKHAENIDYQGIIPFTDRIDYYSSLNSSWGFVLAVEKLLGIQLQERVEYLRIVMAELNRIASHLAAIGNFSFDLNTTTPFIFAYRDRERIIDLFEEISGSRLLYNFFRIGGVFSDFTPDLIGKIQNVCTYFSKRIQYYQDFLLDNSLFIKRTANIGILTVETAISYGVTGPNLRACGIQWDLRKNEPYSIYDRFDFDIPVGNGLMGSKGDCWDRIMVRIHEIEHSINIICQALSKIPDEKLEEDFLESICPPPGEIYMRTESPRGELGYYIISEGKEKPSRVKVRSPSFSNLHVLTELAFGAMVSDIVCILGSLDIMISEVDR